MMKKEILIVFGGKSSEYFVSLHSVASVIKYIDRSKYNLKYMAISQEGKFYVYQGDENLIEDNSYLTSSKLYPINLDLVNLKITYLKDGINHNLDFDIALTIVHGENSEDGLLAAMFKLIDAKYVGCEMLSSNLAMDKITTHCIATQNNIRMTNFDYIDKFSNYQVEELYENLKVKLSLPFFVKPSRAGSSFGVSKVSDQTEFEQALNTALKYDDRILFEATVRGNEFGCAVVNIAKDIKIGEVDMIEVNDVFFDYQNKYYLTNSKIHCPAPISDDLANRIKEFAKKVYQVLDCKDFARVDMFVDQDENIYLNEVNTIPGFTNASRFPQMMKMIGYDFTSLIDLLIEAGLKNG